MGQLEQSVAGTYRRTAWCFCASSPRRYSAPRPAQPAERSSDERAIETEAADHGDERYPSWSPRVSARSDVPGLDSPRWNAKNESAAIRRAPSTDRRYGFSCTARQGATVFPPKP